MDGSHSTNSDYLNRNRFLIESMGIGIEKHAGKLNYCTVIHRHKFTNPIESFNQSYSSQFSISNTISYFHSRFILLSETNVDQFKYFSNLSILQINLSREFYLKTFVGFENSKFKNYFRNIPDRYSQPEQIYGYQLDYQTKKTLLNFNFEKNDRIKSQYDKDEQRRFRLNANFRLRNRNYFHVNYQYAKKKYTESLQEQLTQSDRLQIGLKLKLRGKWSFQQNIQIKTTKSNGLGLMTRFEYKAYPFNIKFGAIFHEQNSGALYFYESDVPTFGYLRGYFHNGMTWYGLLGYSAHRIKLHIKFRFVQIESQNLISTSFGLKYRFQ